MSQPINYKPLLRVNSDLYLLGFSDPLVIRESFKFTNTIPDKRGNGWRVPTISTSRNLATRAIPLYLAAA